MFGKFSRHALEPDLLTETAPGKCKQAILPLSQNGQLSFSYWLGIIIYPIITFDKNISFKAQIII